jgi:hypothetical protein
MSLAGYLRRAADSLEKGQRHYATDTQSRLESLITQLRADVQACNENISILTSKESVGDISSYEDLKKEQQIALCVQEYTNLRSEQRTRLDSANKIIHYSAIVIAAVIAGLLTLYKEVDVVKFNSAFQSVLLLFPLLTMPFALTQQNEEIIVRRIGDYFTEIKGRITKKDDTNYWHWENWHNGKGTLILLVTAFFRSGLLIIFAFLSLLIYLFQFGWPDSNIKWALFAADLVLLGTAISVAIFMANKRLRGLRFILEKTS